MRNVIVAILPALSHTAGNQEHLTFTSSSSRVKLFSFFVIISCYSFIRFKVGEENIGLQTVPTANREIPLWLMSYVFRLNCCVFLLFFFLLQNGLKKISYMFTLEYGCIGVDILPCDTALGKHQCDIQIPLCPIDWNRRFFCLLLLGSLCVWA